MEYFIIKRISDNSILIMLGRDYIISDDPDLEKIDEREFLEDATNFSIDFCKKNKLDFKG